MKDVEPEIDLRKPFVPNFDTFELEPFSLNEVESTTDIKQKYQDYFLKGNVQKKVSINKSIF